MNISFAIVRPHFVGDGHFGRRVPSDVYCFIVVFCDTTRSNHPYIDDFAPSIDRYLDDRLEIGIVETVPWAAKYRIESQ